MKTIWQSLSNGSKAIVIGVVILFTLLLATMTGVTIQNFKLRKEITELSAEKRKELDAQKANYQIVIKDSKKRVNEYQDSLKKVFTKLDENEKIIKNLRLGIAKRETKLSQINEKIASLDSTSFSNHYRSIFTENGLN